MKYSIKSALLCFCVAASSQAMAKNSISDDKFRQLEENLPTPNTYRTASGAPGHQYWQQDVDYKIDITLNDEKQTLSGSETIDYTNNSPDTLRYLWLQLDQNKLAENASSKTTRTAPNKKVTYSGLRNAIETEAFNGGYNITQVTGSNGKDLSYVINGTMMRIDLPKSLKSGDSVELNINWNYQLHEQKVLGGRSGYEYFKEDDNYLYEIASWFPRAAAYYDVEAVEFLQKGTF